MRSLPIKPSLAICIVNWNSSDQLLSCLLSIDNSSYDGFEFNKVVVVDNASTDDSLVLIEDRQFGFPLKVVMNPCNDGFAKACNRGASLCGAVDYILFLNPDTVLRKNSLCDSMRFLNKDTNQSIGIVGVQLINSNNEVAITCSRFPSLSLLLNDSLGLSKLFPRVFRSCFMSEWDHLSNALVDQVMGAFFLVRSSLFRLLDGFDEDFFVYNEEVDFSYRASLAGYKSYYLSTVQVFHEGGGCSKNILAKRLFYILRSKIVYVKKHFSLFHRVFLFGVIFFLEPLTRLFYACIRFNWKDLGSILAAYGMLWRWMIR